MLLGRTYYCKKSRGFAGSSLNSGSKGKSGVKNDTRDTEIKNIVTIAREGSWEGIVGRGIYRSYYKGHKSKIKGKGRDERGRWNWFRRDGGMGRKCRQF